MAKKTRNEVAVGITTLVALALTTYIVVVLSDWSGLFTAQQKITVRLPYKVGLKGLGVGSPIHLGGVKIGQVTRTWIGRPDLTQAGTDEIYVFFTMRIPRDYRLHSDCKLVPQQNILGDQAILYIEDFGREGEHIGDGQTVDLKL
jgi:ABC-type transporter Mla subunit MlaD